MGDDHSIAELLADHRPFHSEFQIEHFIVGANGPTLWGMYMQSLRELESRVKTYDQLRFQLAKTLLDLARQRRLMWSPLGRKRRRIVIEEMELGIKEHRAVIADTMRELSAFHRIAAALKDRLGDVNEERRAELDAGMWVSRLRQLARLEALCTGRIGTSTMGSIMALPAETRPGVLSDIVAPAMLDKLMRENARLESDRE